MRFIHFGCWNEDTCTREGTNGLSKTMKKLGEYVKTETEPKPNFIVVAGDNYYPDKEEKKEKVKDSAKPEKTDKSDKAGETGEAKKAEKTKKEKIKLFNEVNFKSGFDCLINNTTGIPKYVLLGNHEYDTVKNKSGDVELDKCHILKEERKLFQASPDVFFTTVMEKRLDNTLVIMIDTSIYEEAKMDECIFRQSCFNEIFPEMKIKNNIAELIKHQEILVTRILQNPENNKKNIVIIGHHPIFSIKLKIDDNTREEKEKKEYLQQIADLFINNEDLLTGKNLYYLCADVHSYQEGVVKINDRLLVKQYVVGTGGAHQDNCPSVLGQKDNYNLDICKQEFGFLDVNEDGDELKFKFISAEEVPVDPTPRVPTATVPVLEERAERAETPAYQPEAKGATGATVTEVQQSTQTVPPSLMTKEAVKMLLTGGTSYNSNNSYDKYYKKYLKYKQKYLAIKN